MATSKTHKDPFESGHTDIFEIEAMDIGEPEKIKYVRFSQKKSVSFYSRTELVMIILVSEQIGY